MSSSDSLPVRRLVRPTEDDVKRILKIFGEAFKNDKAFEIGTGGSSTVRATLLRVLVDLANRNGEIHVVGPEPDFDGVALWAPPGVNWVAYEHKDYQKLLPPEVLEWLLHHAIPKYDELYKSAFGSRGLEVSVQAWHLKLIAVRPGRQRQGMGHALVRMISKEASNGKYRIVADCHTQISVAFLQKLGFRHKAVKNYYSQFGIGFPMWCMLKEPPSS